MAIDKIGSKALTDSSVVAADITPGTVTTTQLAGSITNAKLANSTVTVNGTSISLGASGSVPAVSWQSVVVSDGSTVTTMVAGNGYFVNNTSAAGLVKLPISASAGDTIAIKDYAGNFGTNSLTIQRNGHNIQGVANNSQISTNRASLSLVYVDSTKGWLYAVESNVADLGEPTFITATGGTITTVDTNYKVHTFTGDGCFVVSSLGNTATPTTYRDKVDYLVVAGGGNGGASHGGGGGAGGARMSSGGSGGCYTADTKPSPLSAGVAALTVTTTTYPVSVGAGGAGSPSGSNGSNSVFSTITSTGGGGGAQESACATARTGKSGGSGGGGASSPGTTPGAGGSGNTPPTSPSQGNGGGYGVGAPGSSREGGGGGGANAAGCNASTGNSGDGGDGTGTAINPSCTVGTPGPSGPLRYFAGGGGGGDYAGPEASGGIGGGGPDNSNGTANTGGGGGGCNGRLGGSGIVIVRYKFQ